MCHPSKLGVSCSAAPLPPLVPTCSMKDQLIFGALEGRKGGREGGRKEGTKERRKEGAEEGGVSMHVEGFPLIR